MANTRLISIINEEVGGFLNEFAEEDMVDSRNINLQKEYDDLNKLLWDGKLPQVLLKFDSKKNGYGRVNGLVNRMTREIKIQHLAISNLYKYTYRQFKNIMAHEQIHVYQMGILKNRGGHGWDFEREARRINGMGLGFNITAMNGEDILASDQAKEKFGKKKLIAIILNMDGHYSVTLTTPNVYNAEFSLLQNIFEGLVNRRGKYNSVEITVIETSNPELMGFPVSKSFKKSIRSIPLSDRLFEQLLNDNIIKQVRIKRGVPVSVSEGVLDEANTGEWEQIEII
jgi:hypothetical protein